MAHFQHGTSVPPAAIVSTLSRSVREELCQVFKLFDTCGQGTMDMKELRVALRVVGIEITKDDATLIGKLYGGESGQLTENDFLEVAAHKIQERGSDGLRRSLEEGFLLFDTEGYGTLTARALQTTCKDLVDQGLIDNSVDFDKLLSNLVGTTSMSREEFIDLLSKRGF
eukprot:PhF_6_TR836/c0_g1_i1/m.1262